MDIVLAELVAAQQYGVGVRNFGAELIALPGKALKAGGAEVAENPRARSARLRIARRSGVGPGASVTDGPALLETLGVPAIDPGEVV